MGKRPVRSGIGRRIAATVGVPAIVRAAAVYACLAGAVASAVDPVSVPAAVSPRIAAEAMPTPHLLRFGPEQGLSKFINALTIDRRGHVWVGTGDGLSRYDGNEFRHWRQEPGRAGALPHNNVMALQVDAQDAVWVATLSGLSVLGRDRREFRHIRAGKAAELCTRDISAMTTSASGGVWIGNYAGHLCRVGADGRVRRIVLRARNAHLLEGAVISALHELSTEDVLVGTDVGLLRLRGDRLERLSDDALGAAFVFSFAAEPDGGVWVGADRGLYRFDARGLRPAPWATLRNARYPLVLRDREGGRWIGTLSGLYRETHGEPVALIETASAADAGGADVHVAQTGLESGVYEMAEDREGGLWITTYSQGLAYLPPDWRRFHTIASVDGEPADQLGFLASAVGPDGNYWVLAQQRLYRLDPRDARLRARADVRRLGVDRPRAMRVCDDGRVWIVDADGVVVYDPAHADAGAEAARRWLREAGSGMGRQIERLLCMPEGAIWASLSTGAIDLYDADGRLRRALSPTEVLGSASPQIAEPAPGPDGRPWLTAGDRLRRWDGQRFVDVPLTPGQHVYAFAVASATELWVARLGALEHYRWDGRGLRLLRRVGTERGMPAVEISGVSVAANGQVWISTVRGLALYDRMQSRVRLFGIRDGLPGVDFSLGPPVDNGRGRALALSMDGLVLFAPEQTLPRPRMPELSIDRLLLRRGEREVALDPDAPVTMLPDDRDLRIVPRLLSYSDPRTHRYRYRLHGYDRDWVEQSAAERVFSALPDGRHLLEIQGARADGLWSAPVRLRIEALPPWWRTWWARLGYVLVVFSLLGWAASAYRLRLKRRHAYQLAQQQRRFAEQASDAKSRFLADFGHEVRTPMTGVLGMSELLLGGVLDERQRNQVQSIRRAGEHLLRLVDDALDLARIEAGKLELAPVDFVLDALIADVDGLMRPLAERKGLGFRTQIDADAPRRLRGDVTRIRQILLNLVGNAVKFTERGEVSLCVDTAGSDMPGPGDSPPALRFVVADTGPGLSEAQRQRLFRRFEQAEGARTAARYGGSGLGLSICRELAQAMGGGIDIDSAPSRGTRFLVQLPLPAASDARPEATAETLRTKSGSGLYSDAAAPIRDADDVDAMRASRRLDLLLVEDDTTVAEVIVGLLQSREHAVTHAAHGLAAMTETAVRRFDLALLDLDLPGIDGFALAAQLRANGFDRPLIAITARADPEAEPLARAAGFDGFLRKPLTSEMLIAAIREALAKSGADM